MPSLGPCYPSTQYDLGMPSEPDKGWTLPEPCEQADLKMATHSTFIPPYIFLPIQGQIQKPLDKVLLVASAYFYVALEGSMQRACLLESQQGQVAHDSLLVRAMGRPSGIFSSFTEL